jgi:hypothetical protein
VPAGDETPMLIYYVSSHAKQRAFERYGVRFSDKKWKAFSDTLQKGKKAVQLRSDDSGVRFACYFLGSWYYVGCSTSGAVLTFLPPNALSDEDKYLLKNDERYQQINDDQFHVFSLNLTPPVSARQQKLKPILPEIGDDELPLDLDRYLEQL